MPGTPTDLRHPHVELPYAPIMGSNHVKATKRRVTVSELRLHVRTEERVAEERRGRRGVISDVDSVKDTLIDCPCITLQIRYIPTCLVINVTKLKIQ